MALFFKIFVALACGVLFGLRGRVKCGGGGGGGRGGGGGFLWGLIGYSCCRGQGVSRCALRIVEQNPSTSDEETLDCFQPNTSLLAN